MKGSDEDTAGENDTTLEVRGDTIEKNTIGTMVKDFDDEEYVNEINKTFNIGGDMNKVSTIWPFEDSNGP